MALRGTQPVTIKPQGISDAVDGTNAFPGAMSVLQDLIPSPATRNQFVPRPASTLLSNFFGIATPGPVTALIVIGTRAYGMIGSALHAGHDQPFCYDLVNAVFIPISNITAANTPVSPATTGDWTPPTMAMIAKRIMITHPGYDGVSHFVGWIDVSNFVSATVTGDTHTNTLIDGLSSDVLQDGWEVGQVITSSAGDILAGTYITDIASDGLSITISQAATGSNSGSTFTVSGGTDAAPIYDAGQTYPNRLVAIPVAVAEFNGRAYYAVNNGVQFSDSLVPLLITNANQALTMGDSTPVTALTGVPLANQVIGGVVQSLIAFKGIGWYYQVTGDPATMNLANNVVEGSVGTLAPNSIAATPQGIFYIAPDGLRVIGPNGICSPPQGLYGQGVSNAFLSAVNPSRMCAAYNQNVYRVSVQNGSVQGQPLQEYWIDLGIQSWTGPHSFPASLIVPYYSKTNSFILAVNAPVVPQSPLLDSNGNPLLDSSGNVITSGPPGSYAGPGLWQSTVLPAANSTYTENGSPLSWAFQPCLSPDNGGVSMNSVIWALIGLALTAGQALSIIAQDESGTPLDAINLMQAGAGASVWDSFNWGAATWGAPTPAYKQYQLNWHLPLVFKQLSIRVTGASMAGFVIGDQFFRYKPEGYPIT